MLSTEALTPEKSAFDTCSAVLSTLPLTPEKSAFFSVLIHNSRLHDYVVRTVPWRLLNGDGADVKPPPGRLNNRVSSGRPGQARRLWLWPLRSPGMARRYL
ncbi:hypothetical protein KMM349_36940 [Stenotrophomonas maltophilia]|nr:hypothetical protein KMM349_36940 [Stenotrophomonas maltophilia]